MIILDANLLIYAYDSGAKEHAAARRWLEELFSSPQLIGLPIQTLSAFLRIITHSRLPGTRFAVEEAVEIVDEWLALPQVRLLVPGERHWAHLRRALLEGNASGPLVTDAHIAAVAAEFGGIVHTKDRDFARFPGLRWVNPLIELKQP